MCGICGIVSPDKISISKQIIEKMLDSMKHRGPDEKNILIESGIALGSCRLRIIDIKTNLYPLSNEDKSILAVANGEIYNFRELRLTLEDKGHIFRTNNDLEVIPHLYEEHGLDFVNLLDGMFAIAVWDKRLKEVILVKDRFGIKPLHYASVNGSFLFGSEIKSLLAFPGIKREIDPLALDNYLTLEYIPSPKSIFKGIHKIPPAHLLVYKSGKVSLKRYWSIRINNRNRRNSEKHEREVLSRLFNNSVKKKLVSDVPAGVFLSGGLDSSYLLSRVKDFSPHKVKTFSIGFDEPSFDESRYSKRVSAFFGTEHKHKCVRVQDVINILPQITDCLDEPFADGSFFPTYILSSFSRKDITVALSGEGGDELFAGYPTYVAHRLFKLYSIIPRSLRKSLIEKFISKLPVNDNNFSLDFCAKRFIDGIHASGPIERHINWMGSFDRESRDQLLNGNLENYTERTDLGYILSVFDKKEEVDSLAMLQYFDINTYLAEDLLVKADRASMMNSQEIRVPYLERELVEFAINLPLNFKMRNMKGKYLLRKEAAEYLPRDIVSRRKKGFGMPVSTWIKNGLREYILDMLSEERIKREGLFDYGYIKNMLDEHFENKIDNRKKIWTLFMFELWHQKYMG